MSIMPYDYVQAPAQPEPQQEPAAQWPTAAQEPADKIDLAAYKAQVGRVYRLELEAPDEGGEPAVYLLRKPNMAEIGRYTRSIGKDPARAFLGLVQDCVHPQQREALTAYFAEWPASLLGLMEELLPAWGMGKAVNLMVL